MRPDVKKLIDWATANGWTNHGQQARGGHYLLRHTSGAQVTVAHSPSDWRTIPNTYRDIARATGQRPPKQRTGRSRHPGRRNGFDMDAAVREQAQRRAMTALREEIERQCTARVEALRGEHARCLDRLAAIGDSTARLDSGDPRRREALKLITRCLDIEAECEKLGARIVVPVANT
ncbi:hypothetical protein [Streptomyces chartreusis]